MILIVFLFMTFGNKYSINLVIMPATPKDSACTLLGPILFRINVIKTTTF